MASHVTIRLKWGELDVKVSAYIEDSYPDAANDASAEAVRALTGALNVTVGASDD